MTYQIKKAHVELEDLEELGWDFDPWIRSVMKAKNSVVKDKAISYEEAKKYEYENYHAEISIDSLGETFISVVKKFNTAEDCGIEHTGDNSATINDLKQLESEGKLFNVKYAVN